MEREVRLEYGGGVFAPRSRRGRDDAFRIDENGETTVILKYGLKM